MSVTVEIDAIGMACPLPVIELAKAIEECDVGDVAVLRADDAAARVDVPVWCRMKRQRLVSAEQIDGIWVFEVEKIAEL